MNIWERIDRLLPKDPDGPRPGHTRPGKTWYFRDTNRFVGHKVQILPSAAITTMNGASYVGLIGFVDSLGESVGLNGVKYQWLCVDVTTEKRIERAWLRFEDVEVLD